MQRILPVSVYFEALLISLGAVEMLLAADLITHGSAK